MNIPKTYLSFHDVTGLQAAVGYSYDAPLVLTVDGAHGSMQITIFLQPLLTKEQTETLVNAINVAMVKAEPAAACPVEKAAYKSQEEYWAALKRDLNAQPIGAPPSPEAAAAHYLVTGSIK